MTVADHAGVMDRPLEDLPALTKTVLMQNFDEVVTDRAIRLREVEQHFAGTGGTGRFRGRYTISASSGSTGQRGFFHILGLHGHQLLSEPLDITHAASRY